MVENFDEKIETYEEEYWNFVKDVRGIDLTFYGYWQEDFGKLIIELADLESNVGKDWVSILDIGCATALNLRAIDELNIFKKIYGIDISNYMINTIIPEMYKDHKWNADTVDFFCTPSHDLSMISDGDIDLVLATHVFEHLKDEEDLTDTLKEIRRVMHKEGKMLAIIPCVKEEDKKTSPLHKMNHTVKWWNKKFSKYFKSESYKARVQFKKTKLKPNRDADNTFYDEYKSWDIFRFVHK